MSARPHDVLASATTIAVVGASKDPTKPGATIPMAMQRHGFRIIPVNPAADVLFGQRVYKTLADVPGPVDIVNVFRPAAEAPDIAEQAVAIQAKALWLQTGILSDEARQIAEAGGLAFIEDHCIAVERAKYRIEKP
jgi:predicted CoA-binding protein